MGRRVRYTPTFYTLVGTFPPAHSRFDIVITTSRSVRRRLAVAVLAAVARRLLPGPSSLVAPFPSCLRRPLSAARRGVNESLENGVNENPISCLLARFHTAMPHAASLQSFLDTCSQGHFDNSSAWVPLHAHCRHVPPVRRADRRERVLGTEGGGRARARAGDEVVVVGTMIKY